MLQTLSIIWIIGMIISALLIIGIIGLIVLRFFPVNKKGFEKDSRKGKSKLMLKLKSFWDETAELELDIMNTEERAKLLTRKLIAQNEINRLTEVLVAREIKNRQKLKEANLTEEDIL